MDKYACGRAGEEELFIIYGYFTMILGALVKKVNFGRSAEQWLHAAKQRGGRGFLRAGVEARPTGKGWPRRAWRGSQVQLGNQFEKGGVRPGPPGVYRWTRSRGGGDLGATLPQNSFQVCYKLRQVGRQNFPEDIKIVTLQLTESFASGKGGKEPVTT